MIAYKFLKARSVGPFSGFSWKPGAWVEAARPGEGWGVHACRPQDLSWWIDAELWRIELGAPIRERAWQIEARRGRLIDRLDEWNEGTRAAFGLNCIFQTRDVSVSELRKAGHQELSDRLAAARTLSDLLEATSVASPPGFPGEMFGYAHDAARAYTARANEAEASFIASVATAAALGLPSGFDDERHRESRWIAEEVGIAAK